VQTVDIHIISCFNSVKLIATSYLNAKKKEEMRIISIDEVET